MAEQRAAERQAEHAPRARVQGPIRRWPSGYKAIVDAYKCLISCKRFNDITVAATIAEADVGKATFYRYFHDKYDAMNSNCKELFGELLSLEDRSSYRDLYCWVCRSRCASWVSVQIAVVQ